MPNWFHLTIRNAATTGGKKHATLKITGIIGGGWLSDGTSAKQFLQQLEMAGDVGTIEVLIDSPGGSISDGLTMYDALRAHPATVTTNVIGTAASMASVLMLAGDDRQIAENGRVMVHRANGGISGTHEEITRYAEILKQFEDRIVGLYTERTAQSEKDVRAMMNTMVGTWFFGEEAVKKGFATQVTKGTKAANFAREWAGYFDVLPSALFDIPASPEAKSPDHGTTIMTAAQKTRFRALLALATRKPEEDTALATLQALATKEGYDTAAIKADNDADTITALNARLATLEAQAKTAQDAADKLAKEKADAEAKAKDPAALLARVNTLEALIKSGVLRDAGGTSPAKPGKGSEDGDSKHLTRAEFDTLNVVQREEFFRKGGRIKS